MQFKKYKWRKQTYFKIPCIYAWVVFLLDSIDCTCVIFMRNCVGGQSQHYVEL